jgi:hypothetical protein
MLRSLPRWMLILLIAIPLTLVLLCGGIIVFERMSANQRIARITQEFGLDPTRRLATARHCEFFRCRSYQWFTTAQTFEEFEQQVARTQYQPIVSGLPQHVGEQPWLLRQINSYTRHQFTQNGSRTGETETSQWVLKDKDGKFISIYFHLIKGSEDIYMFDNQRIQEDIIKIIIDM